MDRLPAMICFFCSKYKPLPKIRNGCAVGGVNLNSMGSRGQVKGHLPDSADSAKNILERGVFVRTVGKVVSLKLRVQVLRSVVYCQGSPKSTFWCALFGDITEND